MQTCPHCEKENNDTDAYCYSCGHILPSALAELFPETERLETVYESLPPQRRWGTAYFDHQTRLRLTFRDSGSTLTVAISGELVLGRGYDDPAPDIDLTPYDAVEKGVSRRHVLLSRQHDTVSVTDLGSANGTYLNGQHLLAHEPRILRDGDDLRLGHLVIRVAFV